MPLGKDTMSAEVTVDAAVHARAKERAAAQAQSISGICKYIVARATLLEPKEGSPAPRPGTADDRVRVRFSVNRTEYATALKRVHAAASTMSLEIENGLRNYAKNGRIA